jgi:inorganic pyrophosphatase
LNHRAAAIVTAFIEIVPTDTVKYELDKRSRHLRLDRPQRYSSLPPTPYGFMPQTYYGDEITALRSSPCSKATSRTATSKTSRAFRAV